jgi:hypothetical protein
MEGKNKLEIVFTSVAVTDLFKLKQYSQKTTVGMTKSREFATSDHNIVRDGLSQAMLVSATEKQVLK